MNNEVSARERAYRLYGGYVTRLGLRCPEDEGAFAAVHSQVPEFLQHAEADKQRIDPQLNRARAMAGEADKLHEEKSGELAVLHTARSLLPIHALQRRELIADGARVPLTDLPYAAELIDIAKGQERWRPAAEKVLRSFGLRLLVLEQHKNAVREFIDTHDMQGIVEYSIVTGVSAHQPRPEHDTLAGKLSVEMSHRCGPWLAAQLVKRFDHVCVETARDLEQHRVAVTLLGTVKLPGNHYRKDDRPELTRPSSYILGTNAAAKRAALELEVAELETAKKTTTARAEELDIQAQTVRSTIEAAKQILNYTTWADLDHWTSRRTAQALASRIEDLKAGDVNLLRLEQQRDKAKNDWDHLVDKCAFTRNTIKTDEERSRQLTSLYQVEEPQPHVISEDRDRVYLDEVYAELGMAVAPETIGQARLAFRRELERRRDTADSDRRLALTRIKWAIDAFIKEWPDAAPDTSGDPERSGGAFAALHEEISQRKLPQAMERFQKMISEDMVPSVSFLQRAIEKAAADIRDRVTMVNAGLSRVEFNVGTHLQIAIEPRQFDASKEFRRHVDALLRNAPAARKDTQESLRQFKRVRELMARFTTTDTEAERWRREVLDVRLSYAFYGREETPDRLTVHTYRNTASNSGGEQEKLVAFCLAAALSYNLAGPDSGGRPRFAPLMLDEAFSKSDETFSAQALSAFDEFGFQLLVAAPIRMSGVLEPFIGQAILIEKRLTPGGARSNAASATFGELAIQRFAELDGAGRASA
ncbi:SbcC/MukB-like Walker B domain-containing protein [Sphaerisporangium sp. NPDC051017]|uniref:ATP-binding protein n=1 Tax=Sphaerisporangium sp. NPDC051017 TaxID=3154636 RepID=UPI003433D233